LSLSKSHTERSHRLCGIDGKLELDCVYVILQ